MKKSPSTIMLCPFRGKAVFNNKDKSEISTETSTGNIEDVLHVKYYIDGQEHVRLYILKNIVGQK